MQQLTLPHDYALVLQTVHESGEEDFAGLAESLHVDRGRLTHIVENLRHKGLIYFTRPSRGTDDVWIRLSTKGRKFMAALWPESRYQYTY